MALLDQILESNARATRPSATGRLCVVTCVDPRLTRLFSATLGLERLDATVVRLPGPAIAGGTDLVRAVATAVFANGCDEVLVLAHTDCALIRLGPGDLAAAMEQRGVGEALPDDPGRFFGLAESPWQIASETAAALRSSPLLPPDTPVHAAVVDLGTGALHLVSRGDQAPESRPTGPSALAPEAP